MFENRKVDQNVDGKIWNWPHSSVEVYPRLMLTLLKS